MDYQRMAKEILQQLGGSENVISLAHCATRLRLQLKNVKQVEDNSIRAIKGVLGVVRSADQYQIIIGNDVNRVYDAFMNIGSFSANSSEMKKSEQNVFFRVCEGIASVFTPILAAITAAGMLQALLVLFTSLHLADSSSSTYYVLNKIANAGFYFLPVMLAYTAAKKFKCDPFMAVMLAGILLHPDLMRDNYVKVGYSSLVFFGISIHYVVYASSVIPILLGVFFMSYVEQFAEKVSPKTVKFFVKPLLTILITAPVTLLFLGPLGDFFGAYLSTFIAFLNQNLGWLAVALLGAFDALIVMTGMHYALFPVIIAGFAAFGFDGLLAPSMLAANIAQGGAAFAVSLRTRNRELKTLSASTALTAVLGITEPAMYGVNLRLKKPFIGVIVGGASGALFAGCMGLKAYAMASPGLAAIVIFLGGNGLGNFVAAIITSVIAFGSALAVTLALGFEDIPSTEEEEEQATFLHEMPMLIESPVKGTVVPLDKVRDIAFAGGSMGKGAAVLPDDGKILAPFAGHVTMLFPTNHAIGLVSEDGVEVLIHVGFDTVKLQGEYFQAKVRQDQVIQKGDVLLTVDLQGLRQAGFDTTTVIVITNSIAYKEIKVVAENTVDFTQSLLTVNN